MPGQLFGPSHVITDHLAQSLQPVGAQQEPDLQRAETTAERHAPFGVVDDAVMSMRLEKLGMNGKRPHQAVGVTQKVSGAVEVRAEPFVRIENNGIRLLDACPEMPEFRTDHRRSRPGRVDMNIEAMTSGHLANGRDIVRASDAGAADACHDAGRQQPGFAVRNDGYLQRRRIETAPFTADRYSHQIVLTDAGDPDRAVDRGVDLSGAVDPYRLLS